MLTVTQITNCPARLYPGKLFLNGLEFSCFLNINDEILQLIFIFSSYFFTLWLVFGSDYSFFIMKIGELFGYVFIRNNEQMHNIPMVNKKSE